MSTIKLEKIMQGPLETEDAQLRIEMPEKKLPVGQHPFQLTVADNSGNKSLPVTVLVVVLDTKAPTAVLVARNLEGQASNKISFGQGFILDGSKSTDIGGGEIVRYSWRLLQE
jgi:hypothetical protein